MNGKCFKMINELNISAAKDQVVAGYCFYYLIH